MSSIRDSVLELHARYAFAIDAADGAAFADCFTAHGALRTNVPREVVGRAALAEFAADQKRDGGPPRTRHISWNVVVDTSGDVAATARSYAAVLRTTPGKTGILLTADYQDRYEFLDGRWLIAERRVTIDGFSG